MFEPSNLNISHEIELQDGYEEHLKWRAQFPVGYLLNKQIEANKKKIIGEYDKQVYEWESKHIADPSDYLGTRPDSEVRWKVL
jgi:hypothetical protein